MSGKPTAGHLSWLARACFSASCKAEEDAAWHRLDAAAAEASVPVKLAAAAAMTWQVFATAGRHGRSVWRNYPTRDH